MKTTAKKTAALLLAFGLTVAACGSDPEEFVDDASDAAGEITDDLEGALDDATNDSDEESEDDGDDPSPADDETSDDETKADESSTSNPASDIPATVVDVALSSPDFSTLVTALTEADLVETLQDDGPFTVFAPTNAAFESILTGADVTIEELLATPDLGDTLLYHVVAGEVFAEDAIAADGTAVETVNGATIDISVVDGEVRLNGVATVITADLPAGNGVVHIIDTVISPG